MKKKARNLLKKKNDFRGGFRASRETLFLNITGKKI